MTLSKGVMRCPRPLRLLEDDAEATEKREKQWEAGTTGTPAEGIETEENRARDSIRAAVLNPPI